MNLGYSAYLPTSYCKAKPAHLHKCNHLNTDLIRIGLEEDAVHSSTQSQIIPRFADHASWLFGFRGRLFLLAV